MACHSLPTFRKINLSLELRSHGHAVASFFSLTYLLYLVPLHARKKFGEGSFDILRNHNVGKCDMYGSGTSGLGSNLYCLSSYLFQRVSPLRSSSARNFSERSRKRRPTDSTYTDAMCLLYHYKLAPAISPSAVTNGVASWAVYLPNSNTSKN